MQFYKKQFFISQNKINLVTLISLKSRNINTISYV